jgi:hypothetical protein
MTACTPDAERFSAVRVDLTTSGSSMYPTPVDVGKVGSYPGRVKSGAGYFFDDVLEYRVWLHPERGAAALAGTSDYFVAFVQYERAKEFSKATTGAEDPLVLIRQFEWIHEPQPGNYIPERGERLAEWQVEWLTGTKRGSKSIEDFLANRRPVRQ